MQCQKIFNVSYEGEPRPVQLWIPLPQDASAKVGKLNQGKLPESELKVDSAIEVTESLVQQMGCRFLYIKTPPDNNFQVDIRFETEELVRPYINIDFIASCLGDAALIDVNDPSILSLSSKLKASASMKVKPYVSEVTDYLVKVLKYSLNPVTRVASKVLHKKESDCGGFHSLFVALLRSRGIPAIMEFGFRGDNASPHARAWYFNKRKKNWVLVDLNDIQDGNISGSRPFVHMSFGTGMNLSDSNIPIYPRDVEFIQNGLVWVDGVKPTVLSEFKILH